MGIFSLFGRKARPPASAKAAASSTPKGATEPQRAAAATPESTREQQALDQRLTARATALKIDAIESEMSSEFVRPLPLREVVAPAGEAAPARPAEPAQHGLSALADTAFHEPVQNAVLEDVPLFEEVAILFANGQSEMVGQMLRDAISADTLGSGALTAWAMLFDLYQISGNAEAFDDLSIAYANHFETSPPAWVPQSVSALAGPDPLRTGSVPSIVFTGKLDAGVTTVLEKARALSEKNTVLRLEFQQITEVDPDGCSLLLQLLKQFRKSGLDLVLVGAPELASRVRDILAVGRRDETDAPWLLLLELLELLNQETAFEEASIDYCVTFEVSPPAFVAPPNKITTAMEELHPVDLHPDSFVMPAIIEGRTDALVATLASFVNRHNPALIDCAGLARIDSNAAGQLMSGLMPLTGDGRLIEFTNVNHLVAALLNVIGLRDIARITTRRL